VKHVHADFAVTISDHAAALSPPSPSNPNLLSLAEFMRRYPAPVAPMLPLLRCGLSSALGAEAECSLLGEYHGSALQPSISCSSRPPPPPPLTLHHYLSIDIVLMCICDWTVAFYAESCPLMGPHGDSPIPLAHCSHTHASADGSHGQASAHLKGPFPHTTLCVTPGAAVDGTSAWDCCMVPMANPVCLQVLALLWGIIPLIVSRG
jgi:hypothetical protein